MDLSVLHPVKAPGRDYVWKDKLNSLTGHLDCRFLEWTGWYNQDIYQRLLGHYRLYQLFKKESKAGNGLPQPLAYIVNYRASHSFKYLLSRITGILYYIGSFGQPYHPLQTEGINKLLVNEYAHILQGFLAEADNNFEEALSVAVVQIMSPEFGRKSGNTLFQVNQSAVILQTRNEFNSYHNSIQYFNEYTTVHSPSNRYRQFIQCFPQLHHRIPIFMIASYLGVTRETLTRIQGLKLVRKPMINDTFAN